MRAQETPRCVCVSVCCRVFLFPSFPLFGFFERFSLQNLPLFPARIFLERQNERETTREKKKKLAKSSFGREREREKISRESAGGRPLPSKKNPTPSREINRGAFFTLLPRRASFPQNKPPRARERELDIPLSFSLARRRRVRTTAFI